MATELGMEAESGMAMGTAMENIRKAMVNDLSRIAEILVFVKRIKYRPIFRNDAYSFGELQVLSVAEEYSASSILNHIWVYDDGIVKGMIHIEDREIRELYVDSFFSGAGSGDGTNHIRDKEISRNLFVGAGKKYRCNPFL